MSVGRVPAATLARPRSSTEAGATPRRPPVCPRLLLIALLAVDATMLVAVVAQEPAPVGPMHPEFFADGGVAESFGYVQLLAAVAALSLAAARTGVRVYGAWALLLGVVVLDDSMRLHENWGSHLAEAIQLPAVAGLRAQDLGEIAVWVVLGALPVVLVGLAHARAPAPHRRRSTWLAELFAALFVSAAVLDMLVVAAGPGLTSRLLALAENGGELVVVSLIAVLSLHLERATRPVRHVPLASPG